MNFLRTTAIKTSTIARGVLARSTRSLPSGSVQNVITGRTWMRSSIIERCRHFSSTPYSSNSNAKPSPVSPRKAPSEEVSQEPRLAIVFTCTVSGCGERSAHHFTKRAYERGVVLVQCPKCKNRHLIADHLGWFKESTQNGKLKTVEDLLREKGETITRGSLDIVRAGVVEFTE